VNFFGLQDVARRNSLILLGAFTAAMLVFGWIISKVTLLVAKFIGLFYSGVNPTLMQFIVVGALWGFVLYRCYVRYKDVNKGGGVLAEYFGAARLRQRDATGSEKDLVNIIDEMAIAAGQKPLPCYIMRNEPDINAFVLGKQKFPAVVVTQGLIDHLDREEMSAVIAHEYAHIANHDLKLNMRMLIALGGLNAIDEIGIAMIDSSDDVIRRPREESWFGHNEPFGGELFVMAMGVLVRILGCILVFFGNLIKAGFSRKRELLADAKAVQFTRETWGLASVLDKVSDDPLKPALRSHFAGELEHLCLSGPWKANLFTGLLSSHPSPAERIRLVEPHFDVKKRSREHRENAATESTQKAGGRNVVPTAMPQDYVAPAIQDFGNELAIVLSMMVGTAGYNAEKSNANFQKIMQCYTADQYAMRNSDEPGIQEEFEKALVKLQQQSPFQRQALIDHITEIMQYDGISTPEEKAMLDHIAIKLNPPTKAA